MLGTNAVLSSAKIIRVQVQDSRRARYLDFWHFWPVRQDTEVSLHCSGQQAAGAQCISGTDKVTDKAIEVNESSISLNITE